MQAANFNEVFDKYQTIVQAAKVDDKSATAAFANVYAQAVVHDAFRVTSVGMLAEIVLHQRIELLPGFIAALVQAAFELGITVGQQQTENDILNKMFNGEEKDGES